MSLDSLGVISSLQQVQSMLATMQAQGQSSSPASDQSAIASFESILSSLSATGTNASGIMGLGSSASNAVANTTTPVPTGPTGADVVADAKKYLGVPYVFGGESTSGMDCSGLVQQTYKDLGITLGRGVTQQATEGTAVPSLAQAQPGDLIVFKGGGHVAIYEGNDTVIHAPMPGRYVQNEKLWVDDSGIETIRRIVPSSGSSTSSSTAATTPTTAVTPTSASVQAAALAAVQAIIQADFSLLTSPSSSTSSSGTGSSTDSQLQSALSSLQSATGVGSTTATTTATASTSAQQALAMEESMLAQEQL